MSLKEQLGKLWYDDRLSLSQIEQILETAQKEFPLLPDIPPYVMEEVLEAGFRKAAHLSKEDAKKRAKEYDAYFREVFAWAFKYLAEANYYKPTGQTKPTEKIEWNTVTEENRQQVLAKIAEAAVITKEYQMPDTSKKDRALEGFQVTIHDLSGEKKLLFQFVNQLPKEKAAP